ncbi:unnamed protein product [Didymodactylos carnosus]|uniref:Uncharacterized protein n=2 Tax=Didymodactylos carnosus TaxID=1234261 RepID=A0A813NX30_9BILA|nr:unnamed protein product [Didymodactylos carnosus]CAF3520182.1 unnamed protein product [Didymodactylos carnosus]
MRIVKNQSVIAMACCRNVHRFLPVFRRNVERIVSVFKDYKILLGESDSSDRTLSYLYNWSLSNKNVIVQSYAQMGFFSKRAQRIAHCRNSLITLAKNKSYFYKASYYLVMDVDVTSNDVLSLENFLSNFEYPMQQWAAMTATQVSEYYDIWALRTTLYPYDCWEMVKKNTPFLFDLKPLTKKFISIHQKPIPREHPLIEVDSSFGGFGLYSTKYLHSCKYSGYEGYELCEHVSFNKCVKKNSGRIFINPRFQIA